MEKLHYQDLLSRFELNQISIDENSAIPRSLVKNNQRKLFNVTLPVVGTAGDKQGVHQKQKQKNWKMRCP